MTNDRPPLIYVASPFGTDPARHGTRTTWAQEFGRRTATLFDGDRAVFYQPIAFWTDWATPESGVPLDTWPSQERGWLAQADALWVLTMPGHEASEGIARERTEAARRGMPILEVDPAGSDEALQRALTTTVETLNRMAINGQKRTG